MTTRHTAWGLSLVVLGLFVSPPCGAGHVTPTLQPPCSADGHCPPRGDWGWTQPKWRRWPGSTDAPLPGKPGAAAEGLLPGRVTPVPTREDVAAPPNVEAIAPRPKGGEAETEMPPLPEFDAGPNAPRNDVPAAPGGADERDTPRRGVLDLPPVLPFGEGALPPAAAPTPAAPAGATPPPFQFPANLPRNNGDRPPVLPMALRTGPVNPIRLPLPPAQTSEGVQQATATVSPNGHDAPPALPALFLQQR